ncbi:MULTISPECIES: DUF262 domain-containing protein [unclassified Saccharothrix]|uniref:DUF262 domain-containing protein n=1 Tax=unclassified Saccharothrix TaxID=2593673 RepID=UPI00307FCE66
MKKLEAHEVALAKVFSSDYEFVIPDYQRPYRWPAEQATQLLEDLREAVDRDPDDPYFLGSIVLVKEDGWAEMQVIDGQQRLTTLTILLAVLRDLSTDVEAANLLDLHVREPGNKIQGLVARPRLRLRKRDEHFFRDHVQKRGSILDLRIGVQQWENDAQQRIAENAIALREELANWSEERRLALAATVVNRTYLVVVRTSDLPSAYRIFSVMNSRGLELSPADIFKSKVVGALPEADRKAYAAKWEDLEADLGVDGFADLFAHIRTVFLKYRPRKDLLTEFGQEVLKNYLDTGTAAEFVDEVLVPYGAAYRSILARDYHLLGDAGEINQWLERLHRLDNFDWQAPALWAITHRVDRSWLVEFLRRLERLGAWMLVSRFTTHSRGQRIAKLLHQLESGDGLDAPALDLDADERLEMVRRLDGDVYLQTPVRKFVLLRLDELVSDPAVAHDAKIVTVEHVLPQNPKEGSSWTTLFTPEQRVFWTHRLANLVLLSRNKNSSASNFDFPTKKTKYFMSGKSAVSFALTSQVLAHAEWTPDVLERRQGELVGLLSKAWDL